MKLVVGLGNPGKKYVGTRHNVGFDVLARLAERFGRSAPREKFHGEIVEAEAGGERLLLLAPHTYMNLSGTSVLAARDFYKIELSDVLVVCDDFSLPLGRLRFRSRGSAGGQRGLEDVIRRLGDDRVARLRLGIGPTPPGWDAADFVLGRFTAEEQPLAAEATARAADAVVDWGRHGVDYCMNQYNAAPP